MQTLKLDADLFLRAVLAACLSPKGLDDLFCRCFLSHLLISFDSLMGLKVSVSLAYPGVRMGLTRNNTQLRLQTRYLR
jgi:hypothetical protein